MTEAASILDDDGFTVTRASSLDDPVADHRGGRRGPRARRRRAAATRSAEARGLAPDAAIVVVSDDAHAADATVALHAGAEDQLPRDATFADVVAARRPVRGRHARASGASSPRKTRPPSSRTSAGSRRSPNTTCGWPTGLNEPVVFVFVRLEDHDRILREEGPEAADTLARDASSVILEAVRDSDLPARIAPDTICVLLTGASDGAEGLVLSTARGGDRDARRPTRRAPRVVARCRGTARYEPGSGTTLADILSGAVRGLTSNRAG
jgi:hypothetical protein